MHVQVSFNKCGDFAKRADNLNHNFHLKVLKQIESDGFFLVPEDSAWIFSFLDILCIFTQWFVFSTRAQSG